METLDRIIEGLFSLHYLYKDLMDIDIFIMDCFLLQKEQEFNIRVWWAQRLYYYRGGKK